MKKKNQKLEEVVNWKKYEIKKSRKLENFRKQKIGRSRESEKVGNVTKIEMSPNLKCHQN